MYPLRCEGLCVSDKRFCQYSLLRLFARIFAPFRGFGAATGSLADLSGNSNDLPSEEGQKSFKTFSRVGKMMIDIGKLVREIINLPPCHIFALNQTKFNITLKGYQ